jgi:hypothetical protein
MELGQCVILAAHAQRWHLKIDDGGPELRPGAAF